MSPAQISLCLQRAWASDFPASIPTVYPGTVRDTSALEEWVELWVDSVQRPIQRQTAPDSATIALTVHCFCRHPNQTTRIQQIADQASLALAGKCFPVPDPTNAAAPPIGWVRVAEAQVKTLTRNRPDAFRAPLHHVVVTFRAAALAQV